MPGWVPQARALPDRPASAAGGWLRGAGGCRRASQAAPCIRPSRDLLPCCVLQASVASAACALLPFVPTYAVALPGCVVLLAQGRLLAAPAFFAAHFGAYYLGDTAILEVGFGSC